MKLNQLWLIHNIAWSTNCVICEADRLTTFAITNTKPLVPGVTLSTQDNTKLFKITIQTHN